jgi:hypothetical protein
VPAPSGNLLARCCAGDDWVQAARYANAVCRAVGARLWRGWSRPCALRRCRPSARPGSARQALEGCAGRARPGNRRCSRG